MTIIKPGYRKEIVKMGVCDECQCEFSLSQDEYDCYLENKINNKMVLNSCRFDDYKSLNSIECPCCNKLVKLVDRDLLIQCVMPSTIPMTIKKGGF